MFKWRDSPCCRFMSGSASPLRQSGRCGVWESTLDLLTIVDDKPVLVESCKGKLPIKISDERVASHPRAAPTPQFHPFQEELFFIPSHAVVGASIRATKLTIQQSHSVRFLFSIKDAPPFTLADSEQHALPLEVVSLCDSTSRGSRRAIYQNRRHFLCYNLNIQAKYIG